MILRGKTISPGVVQGVIHLVDAQTLLTSALSIPAAGSPQVEIERLNAAVGRAGLQLDQLRRQLIGHVSSRGVGIFSAHAALLHDAKFISQIAQELQQHALSAEAAVSRVIRELFESLRASRIPLAQDKAADILDVGRRLLQCLSASAQSEVDFGQRAVIVAPTLTPSELVRFAHLGACGFVTESCGMKSHTAILARGFALPLLTNIQITPEVLANRTEIVLDATNGIAIVEAGPDDRQLVEQILERLPARLQAKSPAPVCRPITKDGVRVELFLNISDPAEADSVEPLAATGIGMFRTEFLYMDRQWWPTEDENYEVYREVATRIGKTELNIRLVDFGAEKCPPYADIPINRNPSLGLRGIRLLLQREDILRPQVRALARLGRERPLTVMLPMLDTIDTLEIATAKICRICGCRDREQLPFRLGTMIEVPSAAFMIREIVAQVDALSIGLNDLTQYILAADRDDEFMEPYHDAMQPAIVRVLHQLVEEAAALGKPVTVCGELAGDPHLTGLLLCLGIRRLSVSQSSFQQVARVVQSLSLASAKELCSKILTFTSGTQVRNLTLEHFGDFVNGN